jgi:hypothetical protein
MTREHPRAWLAWAVCLAGWGLECVLASELARPEPWAAAQTAVAEFVLAIFSLVAGVGTFVLRETFALGPIRRGALDPDTPAGLRRLRTTLLALWSLCLVIGAFGVVIAWGAASPREAWPYLAGALVLLLVYAPRAWIFRPGREQPLTPRP